MSQYWIIVNPKKHQFLYPSVFDDGVQLCALNTSLQALSLLTSNGNGRGGGDHMLPHDPALDLAPAGYYNLSDEEKAANPWVPRDRTPLPEFRLAGTWAGDPIITCGDYCDPEKWTTKAERTLVAKRLVADEQEYAARDRRKPDERAVRARIASIGIYQVAQTLYEDISEEMVTLLGLCGVGPRVKINPEFNWAKIVDEKLSEYLLQQFNEDKFSCTVGKGKVRHYRRDLTWMPHEFLDWLIRTNSDNAQQLAALKTWLRRQKLSPFIRELLPCYRANARGGDEKHDFRRMRAVMLKHEAYLAPDRDRNKRVLPPPALLRAAMDAYALLGDCNSGAHGKTYGQLLAEMVQRRETVNRKEHVRERVIDLT